LQLHVSDWTNFSAARQSDSWFKQRCGERCRKNKLFDATHEVRKSIVSASSFQQWIAGGEKSLRSAGNFFYCIHKRIHLFLTGCTLCTLRSQKTLGMFGISAILI